MHSFGQHRHFWVRLLLHHRLPFLLSEGPSSSQAIRDRVGRLLSPASSSADAGLPMWLRMTSSPKVSMRGHNKMIPRSSSPMMPARVNSQRVRIPLLRSSRPSLLSARPDECSGTTRSPEASAQQLRHGQAGVHQGTLRQVQLRAGPQGTVNGWTDLLPLPLPTRQPVCLSLRLRLRAKIAASVDTGAVTESASSPRVVTQRGLLYGVQHMLFSRQCHECTLQMVQRCSLTQVAISRLCRVASWITLSPTGEKA
jgi:hypothetical protein